MQKNPELFIGTSWDCGLRLRSKTMDIRIIIALLVAVASVHACSADTGHTLASTTPQKESKSDARGVLAAAQRAMGGETAIRRIDTVGALAQCTGPSGPFETRIHSARDGRMRFEQLSSSGQRSLAGINAAGIWSYDEQRNAYDSLDATAATFLHGHELHMLALAPETRLNEPVLQGAASFEGHDAVVLRFRDQLDAPLLMYFAVEDSLPLGLKQLNHLGRGEREIFVSFSEWEAFGNVRLFTHANFKQGTDLYVYEYTNIDLSTIPDSLFERHVN